MDKEVTKPAVGVKPELVKPEDAKNDAIKPTAVVQPEVKKTEAAKTDEVKSVDAA